MEEFHITHYLNKNRWIIISAAMYSAFIFIFAPAGSLLYDSALYADIAKNVIGNFCYCSNFMMRPSTPPVFPLVVAGSMLLFGGLFIKALLALIAFFGIIASYHFILKISNSRRVALLSSVLFFLTPLVIYNSMLLLMDILFAIFIILSIWSYIRFLEKKDRKTLLILAGIAAITIMTKMVGYLLMPIFVIHFIFNKRRHKIDFSKLLILLILIAAFLLPWTLWRSSIGLNEINVGNLLISGGGYGHISLRIESFYSSGEPMNVNPIAFDVNIPPQIVNVARILASLFVYATPIISLYFAYCLTKTKKRFKGRYDSLLLIWIFTFLAFFAFGFFYFGSRYLIPMVLPMIFFFSRFLDSKIGKDKAIAALIIVIQLFSVLAITYFDSQWVWSKSQTEIFAQSGEWLKNNTEPNARILSLGAPEGALVYYGERRVIGLNETIPDYIVKSNFTQSSDVDSYEKQTGAGFHMVKSFSDGKYYAEIYKKG